MQLLNLCFFGYEVFIKILKKDFKKDILNDCFVNYIILLHVHLILLFCSHKLKILALENV